MWRSVSGLGLAFVLVVASCGDSGSGGDGLTVGGYCDPIEEVVLEFAGADAKADHIDEFVDEPESPSLHCIWTGPAASHEVQVDYYSEPGELLLGASAGKSDLAGVDAPVGYVGGGYSMKASNGWVVAFTYRIDSEFADDADALATIANAALGLLSP